MKRVLKLKLVALAVLGGALPASAWALQTPNACGNDEHVRCARYDVNEVYRVETIAGNATLVQFEEGEVVDSKESAVGLGDARAWKVGAGGNWIMFKPVTVKPDTNLIVVTNRRRYTFKLETVKRGGVPTWTLSFDYPDTRARLALEAAKKRALADAVGSRRAPKRKLRHARQYGACADFDVGRRALYVLSLCHEPRCAGDLPFAAGWLGSVGELAR
jgi:type IV secretion system protein VirB9